MDDAALEGYHDRFRAARGAQFFEDVLEVDRDRLVGPADRAGDVAVTEPAGHVLEHLAFARSELDPGRVLGDSTSNGMGVPGAIRTPSAA